MSNLQNFSSTHASFNNHFNFDRHLNRRPILKLNQDAALLEWHQFLAA